MLWFSPPSSTVVKRRHCIVDTSRSWSLSTCQLFVPYSELSGRTASPILRSWTVQTPPASVSDAKTPDVWRAPARQKKPRPPKAVIQRRLQSQSPVVSHQAERVRGTRLGQTKVESLNPQSCCQLRGSSTPETHCCQR